MIDNPPFYLKGYFIKCKTLITSQFTIYYYCCDNCICRRKTTNAVISYYTKKEKERKIMEYLTKCCNGSVIIDSIEERRIN